MKLNTETPTKVLIGNKLVDLTNTKTTFNIAAPTPVWASRLFNVWTFVAGAITLIVFQFDSYLPETFSDIAIKTAALGTPLLRLFTKCFGIEEVGQGGKSK